MKDLLENIDTFTPRDDPQGDLTRLIRSTLDTQGPMNFELLWLVCHRDQPQLSPGTLHDAANNLVAAGFVRISPMGVYYGPAPF